MNGNGSTQSRAEAKTTAGRNMSDWGRHRRARVDLIRPGTEEQLLQEVRQALEQGRKLSVRGVGHSAGGQSFADGGVVVDMRDLDKILEVDPERRTIRVQSGATWAPVAKALEPHRLSITTTQEFKSFSIGGSVAANVHGKTIDCGPLIEGIESLRLLGPDGEILNVSREENAELFPLVIGGYGLFGIVVDVTFKVVPDRLVEKSEVVLMDAERMCAAYLERVLGAIDETPLCYGFLDTTCRRGFYITYSYAGEPGAVEEVPPRKDPSPLFFNLLVRLKRWSAWVRRNGFDIMWKASGKPERMLRSQRLLLWNESPSAFDDMLLQKYFVPVERFAELVARFGEIFEHHGDGLPLLTNHFRYVPPNDEGVLSPAPVPSMCLIPGYLANKDSEAWWQRVAEVTDKLMEATLELGGSYYLTFDSLASPQQLRRAYPRWQEVLEAKSKYDPETRFSSLFFERYK